MIAHPPLRKLALGVAVLISLVIVSRIMYGCGSRSRDDQVADLATRLAQNEQTVEIKEGLYATKLVEMKDLRTLVDQDRSEMKALREQLSESRSELLSTQEVAVRWKRAFEGSVTARQTDAGPSPSDPAIVRKRVEFDRDFGPISVSGHTLTDPPEGVVSIRQTRPLLLTVNIARDKAGRWSSLVTSSEPTMEAQVKLGALDLSVLPSPSWYQRIWVDIGGTLVWDPSVSLGLSYRGNRFSLGASCFASSDAHGCGLTGGARLFK